MYAKWREKHHQAGEREFMFYLDGANLLKAIMTADNNNVIE